MIRGVVAAAGEFNPARLFGPSDKGAFFVTKLAEKYQTYPETTVAGDGDPVGQIIDMSPNGSIINQTVSAARPELTASGLIFDYVDDSITIDFGAAATFSGSIIIADSRGLLVGEFESETDGTIQYGRWQLLRQTFAMLLIDRVLTDTEIAEFRAYIERRGWLSVLTSPRGNSMAHDVNIMSINADLSEGICKGDCINMFRETKLSTITGTLVCNAGFSRCSNAFRDTNLTSFPAGVWDNADFSQGSIGVGACFWGCSIDAQGIENVLLSWEHAVNQRGSIAVNARQCFGSGTNADWSLLSTAAKDAVVNLENNYSWDFTSAFNGRP